MSKKAFIFPGQGSQFVGMGQDLYQEFVFVRELFDMAEETVKMNLSGLCFKGPMDELTKTINLQPAITVVNLACYEVLKSEGVTFDVTAGHSLGEYSAIAAAGLIQMTDVFQLVKLRGELMHRESLKEKGAMAAVIGLDIDAVSALVEQVNGILSVANHNAETQCVVSGTPDAVKDLTKLAKENGGRAVPLKVSGAWHSPLVKGAEDELSERLSSIDITPGKKNVLFNVTAKNADNNEEIQKNLVIQLCSPVKWYDTVLGMADMEVDTYLESGPGTVLTGLVKKTLGRNSDSKQLVVNDLKSLEVCLTELK